MTLRIEDYALIGDCKTAALVGREGSIDWLCWPRFDSAACFAALLGTEENGRWLIAPKQAILQLRRRYRPGTLVLETEFETRTGRAVIVDFMLPRCFAPNSSRAKSLTAAKTLFAGVPAGIEKTIFAAHDRGSVMHNALAFTTTEVPAPLGGVTDLSGCDGRCHTHGRSRATKSLAWMSSRAGA